MRRLGAGGMGEVWLGEHRELRIRRAIKLLPPTAEAEDRLRFAREAEAMACLEHPHVARVHAFGADPRPYLVMDLLTGSSLDDLLREGPLPPERAVQLTEQLADGLEHMHAHGILHRDIKPDNVLFDERGDPVWVDFGLAKVAGRQSLTQAGAIMGTPAYMAPEQANGEAHLASPATDVYGLGALLYRCLAGQPPFQGKSVHAILTRLLTEPAPPLRELAPHVPAHVVAACERALAKDPAQRFASAAAFRSALTLPQPRQLRRAGLAAALAAAALLLASLALWPRQPARAAPAASGTQAAPALPAPPQDPALAPSPAQRRELRRIVLSRRGDCAVPGFDAQGRVLVATREQGLFVYETPQAANARRHPLDADRRFEELLRTPSGCLLASDGGLGYWIPNGSPPEPLARFCRAALHPSGDALLGTRRGWARTPLPPTADPLVWQGAPPDPELGLTMLAAVSGEHVLVGWARILSQRPGDESPLERYDQAGNVLSSSTKTLRLHQAVQPAADGPWLAASSTGQIYLLPAEGTVPTPWEPERAEDETNLWDRRAMPHSIKGLAATGRMVYALSPLAESSTCLLRGWSWPNGAFRFERRYRSMCSHVAVSPAGDWLALGSRDRGELWLLPLDDEGVPPADE